MQSIYAGSTLTIAVSEAAYAESFLVPRRPLLHQPCLLHVTETITLIADPLQETCTLSLPGKTALDWRGWVYQERLLCPRTIYYGPLGLHWECRQGLVCEDYPSFEAGHKGSYMSLHNPKQRYFDLRELPRKVPNNEIKEQEVEDSALWFWADIIYHYTSTRLTHKEDALAALAGIAQAFQDYFHLKASFGVCKPSYLASHCQANFRRSCGLSLSYLSYHGTFLATRNHSWRDRTST